MVENTFVISGDLLCQRVFNAKVEEIKRWHQCSGHKDDETLKILSSSTMVDKFSNLSLLVRFATIYKKEDAQIYLSKKERLDLIASVFNLVQDGKNKARQSQILFIEESRERRQNQAYFM